jgi:hypothetical protein
MFRVVLIAKNSTLSSRTHKDTQWFKSTEKGEKGQSYHKQTAKQQGIITRI